MGQLIFHDWWKYFFDNLLFKNCKIVLKRRHKIESAPNWPLLKNEVILERWWWRQWSNDHCAYHEIAKIGKHAHTNIHTRDVKLVKVVPMIKVKGRTPVTCRKVEHPSCDFSAEKKRFVIVSTNMIICNFTAAAVTRKSSRVLQRLVSGISVFHPGLCILIIQLIQNILCLGCNRSEIFDF